MPLTCYDHYISSFSLDEIIINASIKARLIMYNNFPLHDGVHLFFCPQPLFFPWSLPTVKPSDRNECASHPLAATSAASGGRGGGKIDLRPHPLHPCPPPGPLSPSQTQYTDPGGRCPRRPTTPYLPSVPIPKSA